MVQPTITVRLGRLPPSDYPVGVGHVSPADGVSRLSESELSRYHGFQRVSRQRQFLAGHLLLHDLVDERVDDVRSDVQSDVPRMSLNWTIIASESGAPKVQGDAASGVFLGLSHSGEHVAAAIGECRFGLDIEQISSVREWRVLKETVVGEREDQELLALSEGDRQARFYALWTLKEAWFKRDERALEISQLKSIQWTPANQCEASAYTLATGQFVLALVTENIDQSLIAHRFGAEYPGCAIERWTRVVDVAG